MTGEEVKYILRNTAWLGTDEDRGKTEEAVNAAVKAINQISAIKSIIECLPQIQEDVIRYKMIYDIVEKDIV